MKVIYVIRQGDEIVRYFTDRTDAVRYIKIMSDLGYDDYKIEIVEGF